MPRPLIAFAALLYATIADAEPVAIAPGINLIPGSSSEGRQPDGNSILIDAPKGLILIDTGRHTAHQKDIIAFAKARQRPIAAIINTHWHLDHSGGNAEILAAFPKIPLYASNAIDGALRGFLPKSRAEGEAYAISGEASPEMASDIALDATAVDDPVSLRPTFPITKSKTMKIAGRKIDVHFAPFAATEGDLWMLDGRTGVLVAGDLVVAAAPYLDTACSDGWRMALDTIAQANFRILVPGHGSPMTKAQFLDWRNAFNNLIECAGRDLPKTNCIAGWKSDAAAFIPPGDREIDGLIDYYLDSRLRAPRDERTRYCRPQ